MLLLRGFQDRKRYYSTTRPHLLFIVQIRVCLAFLKLPIINIKPIAIETISGNLANEHQMNRKPVSFLQDTKEEPFKNLRIRQGKDSFFYLLSVRNHILFCHT